MSAVKNNSDAPTKKGEIIIKKSLPYDHSIKQEENTVFFLPSIRFCDPLPKSQLERNDLCNKFPSGWISGNSKWSKIMNFKPKSCWHWQCVETSPKERNYLGRRNYENWKKLWILGKQLCLRNAMNLANASCHWFIEIECLSGKSLDFWKIEFAALAIIAENCPKMFGM